MNNTISRKQHSKVLERYLNITVCLPQSTFPDKGPYWGRKTKKKEERNGRLNFSNSLEVKNKQKTAEQNTEWSLIMSYSFYQNEVHSDC